MIRSRAYLDNFSIPFIIEGVVKDTNDPNQMGRLKVWCPSIDGDQAATESLPWCEYSSPFGGVVNDFRRGPNNLITKGQSSYGFWAIPKLNARVHLYFLNGDPNRRFYFTSIFPLHTNRGLPAGRNESEVQERGPFSDSYDPVLPAMENLKAAFQNKIDSPQAQSRGVYYRQVAQAKTYKDGKEGYPRNVMDPTSLDSQDYCFVTPGGNALMFSDYDKHCRASLKTASGNRIIFDDTNERIYLATARGKTWVEIDEDGHIHIFGSESISFRAGKDFNVFADRNINMEAKGEINIKATKDIKIDSAININLNATSSVYITACAKTEINAASGIVVTGATIHLNGPAAKKAACAIDPPIIPGMEPWIRPVSKTTRNPNWIIEPTFKPKD